jgi:aminoglycoside phosphotransferase (APT) family kinase protein
MLQDMNARPWTLFKHARSLAELQLKIHRQTIAGLPTYKDRLAQDIRNASALNEALQKETLRLLAALPDEQNLCHGDYHPSNVLITRRGPVVIDWMTACAGNPWADVARTSLILTMAVHTAGKQIHAILRSMVRLYHHIYLNRYQRLKPDTHNERKLWMPVIAAARLSENIGAERATLIKMVKEGVKE